MKRPKILREWVGLQCEVTQELRNGFGVFAPGSLVTVTSSGPKLVIRSASCAHCGVSLSMSRVPPEALAPIRRIDPCPPPRKRQ